MKAAGPKPVAGQKPSKTATAKLEAKMKRIRAMTVMERMKEALELGYRAKEWAKKQS